MSSSVCASFSPSFPRAYSTRSSRAEYMSSPAPPSTCILRANCHSRASSRTSVLASSTKACSFYTKLSWRESSPCCTDSLATLACGSYLRRGMTTWSSSRALPTATPSTPIPTSGSAGSTIPDSASLPAKTMASGPTHPGRPCYVWSAGGLTSGTLILVWWFVMLRAWPGAEFGGEGGSTLP